MEPSKLLGTSKAAAKSAAPSVLSPLASFAKKQNAVALGSPVDRQDTETSGKSSGGGKISALASFAKSQQQKAPLPLGTDTAGSSFPSEREAKQHLAGESRHGGDDDAEDSGKQEAKHAQPTSTDTGGENEEESSSAEFHVMDSDDDDGDDGSGVEDHRDEARVTLLDAHAAEADLYDSVPEGNPNARRAQSRCVSEHPAAVFTVAMSVSCFSSHTQRCDVPPPPPLSSPLAKIFVPNASEIPLFHAVLVHDERFLDELLEGMAPEQVLSIRDSEKRSLYHYAALCRRKHIKARVFRHVNRYYERYLDHQIHQLMKKTHQMRAYVWFFPHSSCIVVIVHAPGLPV